MQVSAIGQLRNKTVYARCTKQRIAAKDKDNPAPFATLERGLQLRPEVLMPSPVGRSSRTSDTTPLSAWAGCRRLPLDCQASLKRCSSLHESGRTRVATRHLREQSFLHCKKEAFYVTLPGEIQEGMTASGPFASCLALIRLSPIGGLDGLVTQHACHRTDCLISVCLGRY